MMTDQQYVSLVAQGGTPVRLADQRGAPYPTTGSGALVFANGPTLTNVTFENPIFADSIHVYGTGVAAEDVTNIQDGLDRAEAAGKGLFLIGSFLIKFPATPSFDWANNPDFPTYIAIFLRSNVATFGINCTIEIDPLSFTPVAQAKFLIFGTLLNVAPDTLQNVFFENITFDFNNNRGVIGSTFIYGFGVFGTTVFGRRDIRFITSTDNYNGRGIIAANVYRWVDVNISHAEIVQGYFLNYCYDVTMNTITFDSLAECMDVDAPCWRFNISNVTATNLRLEASLFDFATLNDSVVTGIQINGYSKIVELYNKDNSFADFATWYEWASAKNCSISVASPAVVSCVGHNLSEGGPFGFSDSRGDPAGPLAVETLYWARNVTADTFQVSQVVRQTTLGANPFASTAASAVLTVSDTGHGMLSGQWVRYNGARGFTDIPDDELNNDHVVTVLNANTYTITITTPATASTTGGGTSVYARCQSLVETVSPSVGIPGLRNVANLVSSDNNVISDIAGKNSYLDNADIVVSNNRFTTNSRWWRGANSRLQVNGLSLNNVSITGGRRVLIQEGSDINIDNLSLFAMQPDVIIADQKAAFCATQSLEDALARIDSALDLRITNSTVNGSVGSAFSFRAPRRMSATGLSARNFGSLTEIFARSGFNISQLNVKSGFVNLGEFSGGAGRPNCTDFQISSGGSAAQNVDFTGPFAFTSTATGVTNVAPVSGVTINTRTSVTLPSVTSVGGTGITVIPIYQNNSQYARLLVASIVNLTAITGNATDFTTINIVKSSAGSTVNMGSGLSVDAGNQNACSSRDFPLDNSADRTVVAPGQMLYVQFTRGGSGVGSSVQSLVLNFLALPYNGPLIA